MPCKPAGWAGGKGGTRRSAQLDGQDHTTALQQHSGQPHDLLYSSLTTNAEEKEGRAITEQFICKCLKYQVKASPLAFIRKKTLLNFLVCVSVSGFFFCLGKTKHTVKLPVWLLASPVSSLLHPGTGWGNVFLCPGEEGSETGRLWPLGSPITPGEGHSTSAAHPGH